MHGSFKDDLVAHSMEFRLCMIIMLGCLVLDASGARNVGKRKNELRPHVNPALCNATVAPYGCWPLPLERDIMELQTFRDKLSGKLLPVVWRFDGVGFFAEQLMPIYMPDVAFEIVGDTARFGFKGRLDKVPGSNCTVGPATVIVKDGTVASRTKAILDFDIEVLGPPLDLGTPWRFHFVSDSPDKYVFVFHCANRTNIIDGVCYDRWLLDINIFNLDNPPMHKIVGEMREKFGLKFVDPLNLFIRIGYPCPGDVL